MNNTAANRSKTGYSQLFIHLIFVGFSLLCIVPLIALISTSFSDDAAIGESGYSIFPKGFTLLAYRYILHSPMQIINAYKVTIFISTVGTAAAVLITSGIAYTLSRKNYKFQRLLTFYIVLPMLFNAGLVPSYILMNNYLGLKNNILVLLVPALFSPLFAIILRTFMQKIPYEIIESCKIDGASEFRIFFQIIMPLSKPGLATIALFTLLAYWNDWFTAMMYIDKEKLIPLQYMLQRIMSQIDFMTLNSMPGDFKSTAVIPRESARMAMSVLAAGPMLVVFPFFQKYFVQGLTFGSIKG